MAAEEPFDSARPPDEAWWTRELHRNEKLMDKYMAVLGDNPDWDKWQDAQALEALPDLDLDGPAAETDEQGAAAEIEDATELAEDLDAAPGALDTNGSGVADEMDPDEDPEVNADYPAISRMAREFACHVFNLEDPPCNAELLFLSAGKVGANLAGGHGLGYDDEFICGNIVKCRWALSDCEFCREMLEQLHERTGDADYARLVDESQRIAEAIRERVTLLRRRVWW